MRFLLTYLRGLDWVLLLAVGALILIGFLTLKSTLLGQDPSQQQALIFHQLIALAVGTLLFWLASFINYRYLYYLAPFIYLIAILFLAGVLIFGQDIRGASRWFGIGSFLLQPSEIFRSGLIFSWAALLAWLKNRIPLLSGFVVYLGAVLLPAGLVAFEPDLGTTMIFLLVAFCLVFLSGLNLKRVLLLVLTLAALAPLFYLSLASYQKARLKSFLHPAADPLGAGYNVIQAKIAVGSGRLTGRGWGLGTQSHLNFLPEQRTDFIFAAFGEEMGFLGSMILLIFYLIFLWRAALIAKRAPDQLGFLTAAGLGLLIIIQALVNLAMNLGLAPVTGVTLPWVSYGGSSLIGNLILLGLLENVAIYGSS